MRVPFTFLTLAAVIAAGPALADRPSPEEMAAKKAEMFVQADTDQNGTLTFDEFEQLAARHQAERLQRRFQRADADGDGVVTAEEFQSAKPKKRDGCRHGDRS